MPIHEFSPFYNENLLAELKVLENSNWIDKFHITESDRDFRFNKKDFYFNITHPSIDYLKLNGFLHFQRAHYRLSREKWFLRRVALDPWQNDMRQRNFAVKDFIPQDNDILIFSDIDEIIDSRYHQDLIRHIDKYGIVTIKLHYTLYFLNLFSENWVGPPDYSYRVFLMSGEYFKKNSVNVDQLRKAGERGDLEKTVKCFPEFAGFHHSWLGDEKFLLAKLGAYPHARNEHDDSIYDNNGKPSSAKLREFLLSGKSVYGSNHKLRFRPEVELLKTIEENRDSIYKPYLLK